MKTYISIILFVLLFPTVVCGQIGNTIATPIITGTYNTGGDPFTKVIVHGTYNSTVANTWFEVKSPDGKIYYYGNTPGARQSYTAPALLFTI